MDYGTAIVITVPTLAIIGTLTRIYTVKRLKNLLQNCGVRNKARNSVMKDLRGLKKILRR